MLRISTSENSRRRKSGVSPSYYEIHRYWRSTSHFAIVPSKPVCTTTVAGALLRFMSKMELYNGNLIEAWRLADRAYQLQPSNPEDIANLAQTWVMLGEPDEAEKLVLEGLEASEQNMALLGTHMQTLLVQRRYEEAESMLREQMDIYGDEMPDSLRRKFNMQLGLIAMVRGDLLKARGLLVAALPEQDEPTYSGDEIMILTLAALATDEMGDEQTAAEMLEQAERIIKRGRLNGVDNSGIYYSEAVILTMREDYPRAMEKLQEAYNRGFREKWVLDIDGRLEPLRNQPEFIGLMDQITEDISRAKAEIRSLSLASL